jgi:hypothetical protein
MVDTMVKSAIVPQRDDLFNLHGEDVFGLSLLSHKQQEPTGVGCACHSAQYKKNKQEPVVCQIDVPQSTRDGHKLP